MNGHGHEERLSAFYDGELSAVERAEVERLLTERPELQSELAAMTDLSQRLSDLADDGIEFDLVPGVMEQIRAGGRGPGKSEPLVNHSPASSSAPASFRRRWMPSLLAIASLGLLVAASLPLLMKTDDQLLVDSTASRMAPDMAPMSAAPVMPKAVAINDQFVPSPMLDEGNVHAGPEIAAAMKKENAAASEQDLTEVLQSLSEKRWINPGEMIHHLVQVGGNAMLAEYQVVDVQRSSSNAEYLLRSKGILPLEPDNAKSRTKVDSQDLKGDDARLLVIVIEADPNPLNEVFTALNETEGTKEVSFTQLDSEALNLESVDQGLALNAPVKAIPQEIPSPSPAPRAVNEKLKGAMAPGAAAPFDATGAPTQPPPAPAAAPLDSPASRSMDSPSSIASQAVTGNSLALSNGSEVYPFLKSAVNNVQVRQNATQRLGGTGNSPGLNARNNPGQSRSANGIRDLEKPGISPANNLAQNVELPYNNSRAANRARQLAIVVLKSEPQPASEAGVKAPE